MNVCKALVAMSGGVDSSVAALFARDAGYDCVAVMLDLAVDCNPQYSKARQNDECTDAARVAAQLGIPFHSLDFREFFREEVVERFVASYLSGDTPNPCVECNRRIKFGRLIDYAETNGYDAIVTGHYARIEYDDSLSRYLLKKGADPAKDQSYMLYSLTQRQLSRIVFTLGSVLKSEVREIASNHGFPNAGRRESQDICFIQDGDYARFIERFAGKTTEAGDILDPAGNAVGRHMGAVRYTIGQRKGLGNIKRSEPPANNEIDTSVLRDNLTAIDKKSIHNFYQSSPEPVYVYKKSMADNTVSVGPERLLYAASFYIGKINLIPFKQLDRPMRVNVKTRYRQREQPAVVEQTAENEIHVEFDAPQRAITPGQSAVFYDGDIVIGGGTII